MDINKNLFFHASKELSQDAFLAYLFMNFENNKNIISKFLKRFFSDQNESVKIEKISSISVKKQYLSIDLLVIIHLTEGQNCLIVIEDKTHSQVHNNQLEIYKDKIEKIKLYKNYKKVFVYYKLDFSNEDLDYDFKGWNRLYVNDIIQMFINEKTEDCIVKEYIEYIKYINESINEIPENTNDWNYYSFKSFTIELMKEFPDFKYHTGLFRGKKMALQIKMEHLDYYFEYSYDLKSRKHKIELVADGSNQVVRLQKNLILYEIRDSKSIKKTTKNPYIARINIKKENKGELEKLLIDAIKEFLECK